MKVCVLTLGCKVNKYESDSLIFDLKNKGYETSDKLEEADMYIINTCAVTSEAERKSRQMIARCKKFNKNAKIFVCGCASQNSFEKFKDKGVEYISGTYGKIKIISRLEEKGVFLDEVSNVYEDNMTAYQTRTRAYIKIQDGCDNFCTYCIIPYLRGRSRSRDADSILKEVLSLPDEIQEIVLVGINLMDYKIQGKNGIIDLLEKLDNCGKRIRLGSVEDTFINEDSIQRLSKLKNFCPHFHLSLQSGCDETLKRMNRHYSCDEFYNTTKLIKKYFPLAGITTDVVVGFPEESQEEFLKTCEFVKKVGFSALHIFPYSQREGTVASKIYKDLDFEIKKKRVKELEKINDVLKENFLIQNKEGEVLIEEKEGDFFVGYTKNYVKCYINGEFSVGDIVKVKMIKPFENGMICNLFKN